MNKSNILSTFNDHFVEFVSDVQSVFPEHHDVLLAKNSLIAMRQANPRLIILFWKNYVVSTYKSKIEEGDMTFFLTKDYDQDILTTKSKNSNKIKEALNRLKEPICSMSEENRLKSMKYIQNLTKLSQLYEE